VKTQGGLLDGVKTGIDGASCDAALKGWGA
jgi:hypothetical protein